MIEKRYHNFSEQKIDRSVLVIESEDSMEDQLTLSLDTDGFVVVSISEDRSAGSNTYTDESRIHLNKEQAILLKQWVMKFVSKK